MQTRHIPLLVTAAGLFAGTVEAQGRTFSCPVEPKFPDSLQPDGPDPGGMLGDGWDGSGQNSAVLFFHEDGGTADTPGSREAMISAMSEWAEVVDITFIELPVTNSFQSIDFGFYTGDHSFAEPDETGGRLSL